MLLKGELSSQGAQTGYPLTQKLLTGEGMLANSLTRLLGLQFAKV